MRIRSHIFISVFFATIVPLVALALGASYYSENSYQREIKREIITSLNGMTVEISHELHNSQNLVLGISRAAAVKSFFPILNSVAREENHPSIRLLRRKINRYLEGFQTIIPGEFIIRVLDVDGNTLVKVSHNKTSEAQFESLQGINYVEHQIASSTEIKSLDKLPRDEVSFFTLPHHALKDENNFSNQLLDFAVPLYDQDKWLGTLVVTLSGGQIDHIINNATRLYKGKLLIAENNPDNINRHGLIIYSEDKNLNISQTRSSFVVLPQELSLPLFSESIQSEEGIIQQNGTLIYYSEFYPYPNRLIGWVIATQINEKVISAPFANNRLAIWFFAATALFITLIMTGFAVRKISKPICSLAYQLKSFADGKYEQRANTKQSIAEIQALSSSFNYMADTLVNTQNERDKAQNMVLQDNKLASIGQMAAGIGHEINNPLNNILSYCTLISRTIAKNAADIDTKTLAHLQMDIDSLRNETLRASEIIKGILNFARQMPPQLESFSVKNWLEKSISLVQQTAKSKHIMINLNYSGDDIFEGDQAQLQQVVINLLLNSIQASNDNASININVECNEKQLEVKIQDQGYGISEDVLNKIYDPFFSTKEEGEGTGLGLSISLGIIESHQGSLSITNNSEDMMSMTGTTATLVVPRMHH
ncbi:MAG: HAMP domain-containing histidine kinase [Gammaproteobacteria bacterium]|nr:HAMP domain-containing histidine kinase [Gammaproteobacteria bacterium]MCW8986848.1 HAMP domain-containing histidine kinase [Gammaproteobacteria bacterium]